MNNFCTGELSSFYLDIAKDVVYIEGVDHPHRRAMQTVMYDSLLALLKLLTPIIPHTTDELWAHLDHVEEESVQLTDMPEAEDLGDVAVALRERFSRLMLVRDDVLKALEEARNAKVIGKSLEAKVTVALPEKMAGILTADDIDYAQFFIVSKFHEGEEGKLSSEALQLDYATVLVEKADGEKCDRCWTISESVGTDTDHPELCSRCADVVKKYYS